LPFWILSTPTRRWRTAIEYDLAAQASAVASDINKIMFERLENAATWSTSMSCRTCRCGNVDRRLSDFPCQAQAGYGGVYRELYALDLQHRVVGSSNAADFRRQLDSFEPWQHLTLAGAQISLARPFRDGQNVSLSIRAPIKSRFDGHALGDLQLVFNWAQVDGILDAAGRGKRIVALVDDQGRYCGFPHGKRCRLFKRSAWPAGICLPVQWRLQTCRSSLLGFECGSWIGPAEDFSGFADLG